MSAPACLHCETAAVLTTGREIYPHLPHLHRKPIWKCPSPGCDSHVGCHPGTKTALGRPANKPTRQARTRLHNLRFDPLWTAAPKRMRGMARSEVYKLLSERMGIPASNTHISHFTIEQCRDAWRALEGVTPEDIMAALS